MPHYLDKVVSYDTNKDMQSTYLQLNEEQAVAVPFDYAERLWDQLVTEICERIDVPSTCVLETGRLRPTDKVYQTRGCLVQALFKVVGEQQAFRWLKSIGFNARRIKLLKHLYLPERYAACLEDIKMPYCLKY